MEKRTDGDSISIQDARFTAKVDYTMPTMDELKRHFPSYVHIGRDVSDDTALAEIDKLGFRPALPEEGRAFEEMYPEEAKKYLIVFRGSEVSMGGDCHVASVWVLGDDYRRFLVVRK